MKDLSPVNHSSAAKAMSNQYDVTKVDISDTPVYLLHPIPAVRSVPVLLSNSLNLWEFTFPVALPMFEVGVVQTGNCEDAEPHVRYQPAPQRVNAFSQMLIAKIRGRASHKIRAKILKYDIGTS